MTLCLENLRGLELSPSCIGVPEAFERPQILRYVCLLFFASFSQCVCKTIAASGRDVWVVLQFRGISRQKDL